MGIKVGINGFGRIGRNVLRASLKDSNLEFVAVNDLTDPKTLAHLLKYDSVLGNLANQVTAGADSVTVDGKTIKVFKEKDPDALPWDSVGAQVVIESTGRFTDANDAKKHLRGSVKKVIISAPAKNEDVTLVLGVNDEKYDAAKHHIVSNASCTTNCLAPNVSVVDLVVFVEKKTTKEEVNAALKKASESGSLKGYLGYEENELVSSDFKGDARSSIVDAPSTLVVGGNCVKVLSWYDNEWGYSCRVRDLINYMASKGL